MIEFLNTLVNPVVRAILRSSIHGVLSASLMLLTFTGRKTGRRRTIPVMYARDADAVVVFVGRPERKLWWRNFRGGAPVTVRIGAERLEGFGEVVTEPGVVAAALRSYLAKFPRAARTAGAPERAVMVRVRIEAPAQRSLESIASSAR